MPGPPHLPRTSPVSCTPLHRRHELGLGGRTSASGIIVTAEHSGTHIDALCHQAYEQEMFGGVQGHLAGPNTNRFHRTRRRDHRADGDPRGADRRRWFRGIDRIPSGDLITAQELEASADAQEVSVGPVTSSWSGPATVLSGMTPKNTSKQREWRRLPPIGWPNARFFAVGADNVGLGWHCHGRPGSRHPSGSHDPACQARDIYSGEPAARRNLRNRTNMSSSLSAAR